MKVIMSIHLHRFYHQRVIYVRLQNSVARLTIIYFLYIIMENNRDALNNIWVNCLSHSLHSTVGYLDQVSGVRGVYKRFMPFRITTDVYVTSHTWLWLFFSRLVFNTAKIRAIMRRLLSVNCKTDLSYWIPVVNL